MIENAVHESGSRRKILVVSPTPTHPQNAGNRARIFKLLRALKDQGHEIHFLLADREYASNHVKSKQDYTGMRKAWDRVYSAPLFSLSPPAFIGRALQRLAGHFGKPIYFVIGNLWRVRVAFFWLLTRPSRMLKYGCPPLYRKLKPAYDRWRSARALTACAKDGEQNTDSIEPNEADLKIKAEEARLSIDRWYNFKLDKFVQKLHAQNHYDVVIAEYVFNSRVLNNFGDDVLKIIDTHDIFTDRNKRYEKEGLSDTFFFTTAEEEAKGLRRADKIIAIQDKEAEFFRSLVKKDVVSIGHTVDLKEPGFKAETSKNILYIGSGNLANIEGIKWFIKDVLPLVREQINTAQLLLAGNVCEFINNSEGVKKLGEIKKISQLYSQGDIVINPGAVGTGLKIKSIEALGLGKILVSRAHSAEGLKKAENEAFITAETAKEFAASIVDLMSNLESYNAYSRQAFEFAKQYNLEITESLKKLLMNKGDQDVSRIETPAVIRKTPASDSQKFIIFTFPRTGSTTLGKLLDLHPSVALAHEPFNKNISIRSFVGKYFTGSEINSREKLHESLEKIFGSFTGIKHLDYQLSDEMNEELIKYPNTKIIYLWRRNLLQRIVSNHISNETKHWNTDRALILKKHISPINIRWTERRIGKDLASVNRWRDFIQAQNKPYFELTYEDLYGEELSESAKIKKLQEIIGFLGMERIHDENLLAKIKALLNPENTKLNSELTYRLIPNIQIVDERIGKKETGYIFSNR